MTPDDRRKLAIDLAWRMWGKPYIWGGDDPIHGFDCSGMIVEILQSVGLLSEDLTADGLMRRYDTRMVPTPTAGCLVFWGSNRRATNVEMALNETLSIGARGGGSATISADAAALQNAYVKVRPILSRGVPLGYADPF